MMKVLKLNSTTRLFTIVEKPLPVVDEGKSLLRVAGTCLNRADILQSLGRYPGQSSSSDPLGIECVGKRVNPITLQPLADQTLYGAVLSKGGFSEYAVVPNTHLITLPSSLSLAEAAAVPEAFLTAFQLLSLCPDLYAGSTVYVPAAAGGVGSALVQLLSKLRGCKVAATVNGEAKRDFVRELGAELALDRSQESTVSLTEKITAFAGGSVSAVFDCIGADAAAFHSALLGPDGHWIVYGLLGNKQKATSSKELFASLLLKRLRLSGTTLKPRSDEYKAKLTAEFSKEVVPMLASGELKPLPWKVLPVRWNTAIDADQMDWAFKAMIANQCMGRIVFLFE